MMIHPAQSVGRRASVRRDETTILMDVTAASKRPHLLRPREGLSRRLPAPGFKKRRRSAQCDGGVTGRVRLSGRRLDRADVCRAHACSAHAIRIEGHLVVEQVVADAIGLVSRVQCGSHVAHAPRLGALLDAADGWDVAGGMQADQEQGVA
jgi:hypothetical protein